jgi:hypothetical protein
MLGSFPFIAGICIGGRLIMVAVQSQNAFNCSLELKAYCGDFTMAAPHSRLRQC